MSTGEMRKKLKQEIDRVPTARLASLADFLQFLNRPPIEERVREAEKSIAAGKGVNWRKVRSDI